MLWSILAVWVPGDPANRLPYDFTHPGGRRAPGDDSWLWSFGGGSEEILFPFSPWGRRGICNFGISKGAHCVANYVILISQKTNCCEQHDISEFLGRFGVAFRTAGCCCFWWWWLLVVVVGCCLLLVVFVSG